MGVSKDEDLGIGESRVQFLGVWDAELITVSDNDAESIELDRGHLRKSAANLPAVRISVDRSDRRDRLELGEQLERPHVSRVQDVIDLPEDLEDLGPKETVGVGDDAEPHDSVGVAGPTPGDLDVEVEMIEDPLNDKIDQL